MATENMVKAGRAGLTFGGDWDETVEYNRLVGVRYDNKLFFSKKPVPVGTIPEDGEYWFLAYEGLTDEQYEALLNGTQQVGDSAKLGGKDAELYALLTDLVKHSIPTYTANNSEELLSILAELHANAKDSSVYEAKLYVRFSSNLLGTGGVWSLHGFRDDSLFGWQRFGYYTTDKMLKERVMNNGTWSEIFTFATTSDLAKYLPLSAKPTGTYVGNGSATGRTIDVGGVGDVLLVWREDSVSTSVLVTHAGWFGGKAGSSCEHETTARLSAYNNLNLFTTHEALNSNGVTYNYRLL